MNRTKGAAWSGVRRWRALACAALLAAAAALAYRPALTGDFIWDDDALVTNNALVKSSDGLYRMWFTTEPIDYWPVTNSSFWFGWRLWGLHASGYHIVNLLLHVANALLLWAILRRLVIPGALLAAFLFLLHPVNVESVAWIAQRKNTLSLLFFLLSILGYVNYELRPVVAGSGRLRSRWYWFSLVAFLLAMLSKGSVAILPGVLLLLIWWQRGSITRRDVLRTVPFFFLAAVFTVVNIWFQSHLMTGPIRQVTWLQRVLGAGAVVWFYVYKAVLPIGLSFVYPQWTIRVGELRWWLPAIAAVGTSALLVWQRRRTVVRALLFAWAFYCLALLPVMGFTDVYYMKYSLVSDHYQYIAMLAVAAAAAVGFSRLTIVAKGAPSAATRSAAGRSFRSLAFGAPVAAGAWCAVLLVALGTVTWQESHEYVNAEVLYRETLAENPDAWMVHTNLGGLLLDRSEDEEAAWHFREALRRKPDLVEAHNNLCYASMHLRRMDDAIHECSEALRLNPKSATAHNGLGEALGSLGRLASARAEFGAALSLKPDYAEAHANLANVLQATGQPGDAVAHYREALRLRPDFAEAHSGLALALEQQGHLEQSVAEYREALRMDPRLASVHDRLGSALADLDQAAEAEKHFREALRLDPDLADAHQNLGNLLQQSGRLDEAVAQYEQALRSDPGYAEAHNNLGVVLMQLGHADAAVTHFRAALALRPEYADARRNLTKVLARR